MKINNSLNITENILLDCYKIKYFGVYSIILFIASLTSNILHIKAFIITNVRSTVNYLIIILTVLNLFGTFLELPFAITSALNCKVPFGSKGCYLSAFCTYFVGCMSIYLLIAVSVERYFHLYQQFDKKNENFTSVNKIISICGLSGLLSLFWSLAPMLGWSYYSLEGLQISCSIEWYERSVNVMSYNITIMIFVFLIPLIILVFTNVKILLFVFKDTPSTVNHHHHHFQRKISKRRRKHQKNVSLMVASVVGTYLISWLGYVIVCLQRSILNIYIDPLLCTIPSFFAKSSLLWPSLCNLITNKTLRKALRTQ